VIRLTETGLAQLKVNAVVRAADENLEPVGSASEALDRDAGESLRQLRQVNAPLDVGSAVITGAGELSAEFVLHIVIQGQERAASRDTVRRALTSAWHRAEVWELNLVAAPLAGLGGSTLSPEEAAVALVETFRDRPRSTGFPAELHIVVASPSERGAVEPYLQRES
jgi:O-acetyl-ADP-ribose deacetylase (regulator of RNase III)